MAKYTVVENQTIIDIAIQLYGKADAVEQLLDLNPQLTKRDPAWDMTNSLTTGSVIIYDDEDCDKKVIKELDGKVIISE